MSKNEHKDDDEKCCPNCDRTFESSSEYVEHLPSSIGLIFKCLECMEAAEIVDIIHTQANHKGLVGIITRHVTKDELEELEKKGKIAVYDWARERPDDIDR
ncbi:MAG: hypothetical protein WB511_08750 [Nitrososphaeraceae archaeon]